MNSNQSINNQNTQQVNQNQKTKFTTVKEQKNLPKDDKRLMFYKMFMKDRPTEY